MTRRGFVRSLAAAALMSPALSQAQDARPPRQHGRLKPERVPAFNLVRHDGAATTLSDLLSNHVSAVQLMFSRCTTTCPIQGSVFARVPQ